MLKSRTQYQSVVHITQCLLLFFALMPTTEAVAQSEITHRVTTGDAGYRGQVRSVQIMQSCNTPTERCSRVQEEMFNAEGLRTSIVTIDSLGRFYTKCHYDANGRMRYVIEGFPAGADSIVFHYDRKGCMMASSVTRFTHKGIDKDMSNVFRIECDDHCRPLLYIPPWGDTSEYRYDTRGRLVYRALPGAEETYYYDAKGHLVRQRTGSSQYVDQHFRYDQRGDLLETWHTDWETGETVISTTFEHCHYKYKSYDKHGNWTKAEVTVKLNGKTTILNIIRTFSYYN